MAGIGGGRLLRERPQAEDSRAVRHDVEVAARLRVVGEDEDRRE
jgi:hypothetical protein